MTADPTEQPAPCAHCRRRPAAYVVDRLGQLNQVLSGQQTSAVFPVWACENCVQQQISQVLDVVSIASVCRANFYRSVL
jgi:hypothetical protein